MIYFHIEFHYNLTSSLMQVVLDKTFWNCLGILIWIFLHQVLDYQDVSMKAYNWISHCTWFYIAALWFMLAVVAYICNCTYKFLAASLFMLVVLALGYSNTHRIRKLVRSFLWFLFISSSIYLSFLKSSITTSIYIYKMQGRLCVQVFPFTAPPQLPSCPRGHPKTSLKHS